VQDPGGGRPRQERLKLTCCFLLPIQELQADGYDVGKIPEEEGDLIKSVLNDETARFNSADLNIAYKMPVAEYQKLCPYAEALEENWGKPPGASLSIAPFMTLKSDFVLVLHTAI